VSEVAGASAQPAAGDGEPGGGAPTFLTHKQVMIVLPGLLLTMMLAMLDQMVVGTALPRIVGDLGGISHLSWVVTAYVLTSTITTPFYGKLGDMYGRKKLFIFAIVVFLVGSALSGLANSMTMLIAFRALQGVGAGGLVVGAMATLGEIVPPRERGKYMGYFMVVMTLATVGGPLVGGWITQAISWRWIFYINLPLGGAALVYLMATLKLPARRVPHRIDYLGGILLGVVSTAIILIATWGGTEYRWDSVPVILLMVITVTALAAFLVVERRAAEPMLPPRLFKSRNFSLAMALSFFAGLGLLGVMTFIPLYQQTVQGASPTVSGLLTTPMMFGSAITSVLAGVITTKTGKYKWLPVAGGALTAVGIGLLTGISVSTTRWQTGIDFAVLGLGMGLMMQILSMIAQNSVPLRDMGVATSGRMFFQQMGGSLGVAALGALFASRLTSAMGTAGTGKVQVSGGSFDPAQVMSLPPAVRQVVFAAVAHSVQDVFWAVLPGSILVFVLALFVKEIPLRGREAAGEDTAPAPEAEALIG